VLAWALVFVVALFFGTTDYATHVGYAALLVGAFVVLVGVFDLKPNGFVAFGSRGWFSSRGQSPARVEGEGLTVLGVALFVAIPLFAVGAFLAG